MKESKQTLVAFGAALWVSFISAAVAAMLFFAAFDPVEIAKVATFPTELSRLSGYSIGFLLLWVLLITNSWIVYWLSNRNPNK